MDGCWSIFGFWRHGLYMNSHWDLALAFTRSTMAGGYYWLDLRHVHLAWYMAMKSVVCSWLALLISS